MQTSGNYLLIYNSAAAATITTTSTEKENPLPYIHFDIRFHHRLVQLSSIIISLKIMQIPLSCDYQKIYRNGSPYRQCAVGAADTDCIWDYNSFVHILSTVPAYINRGRVWIYSDF